MITLSRNDKYNLVVNYLQKHLLNVTDSVDYSRLSDLGSAPSEQ